MTKPDPTRRGLLAAAGLFVCFGGRALAAPSVPRRLTLRNANTGETFDGLYRSAAGPIPAAMADLAVLLRDHHVNKIGPLHVETLDFLADVMEAAGQTHATILSAYRTPETNAKLATYLFGVAEKSQHLLGRALDITLDSRLSEARTAARRMGRGGVGWYPRSHFIHLDTGPLRNWENDGSGLEILLADGTRRPVTVAEHRRQQSSPAAAAANLPPCRERAANGVIVLRGMACAP